jgi:hypothetical protein
VKYSEFRTGLTYWDVWRMLWVDNPDPATWRQKSPGVVLWHWHQIKLQLWERYQHEQDVPTLAPEETADIIPIRRNAKRPHLIPVVKEIRHRGRTFNVTYWKKAG